MKILVIDDEKPTLSMFKLFLAAYGYDVHTAENGETGLLMFEKIKPDIVFTDIKMPGMDGLEVLRRIKQAAALCQVIIITGHGDMEKAVQALDLDASDFINKPVERRALNSALARAEKRRLMSGRPGFEFIVENRNRDFYVRITGRLSEHAGQDFADTCRSWAGSAIKNLSLIFDNCFSIDRSGISLLMEIGQQLKSSGVKIVMENLSCSYAEIFRMAGMDRMAELKETALEDQEF